MYLINCKQSVVHVKLHPTWILELDFSIYSHFQLVYNTSSSMEEGGKIENHK